MIKVREIKYVYSKQYIKMKNVYIKNANEISSKQLTSNNNVWLRIINAGSVCRRSEQ